MNELDLIEAIANKLSKQEEVIKLMADEMLKLKVKVKNQGKQIWHLNKGNRQNQRTNGSKGKLIFKKRQS